MAKAQGSTEYLVILAVVLIVALVVIALLGFFPGVGGSARETQSASYWSGAQPLSIDNFKISNVTVTLRVSNRMSEKVLLNETYFTNINIYTGNTSFQAGETKTINGTLSSSCGAVGDGFEYDVKFNYTEAGIVGKLQIGDKPLVGKCS